jgi:hypothetical protein
MRSLLTDMIFVGQGRDRSRGREGESSEEEVVERFLADVGCYAVYDLVFGRVGDDCCALCVA